jgi:aconitate hydratase
MRDEVRQADGVRAKLVVGECTYEIVSLREAERQGIVPTSLLPISLKVMLENILRNNGDNRNADIDALREWCVRQRSDREISFHPTRVLMPDSSGVPLVGDLAALRDALLKAGGDPGDVNPTTQVDIVIDHSVLTDFAGSADSFQRNLELEYRRNGERYGFLKWAQQSFRNVRVVPPAKGIIHQINLEYLARVVQTSLDDGLIQAYPDTLVGMDSHTTMINGIGVIGWGVGGIEAGAAMLGEPISMLLPEVIGCRVSGRLRPGVTCTDIVLTLTKMLRQQNVVGKFLEFFGDGLDELSVTDRCTIANMAPEAGATVSFFPIDKQTIRYLTSSGRNPEQLDLIEAYAREQGLWREKGESKAVFTSVLEFDLSSVRPSMAGPSRPQDRLDLGDVAKQFSESYRDRLNDRAVAPGKSPSVEGPVNHGDIVIAAITSCTSTSNPHAMIGAGLIARNLVKRGIASKPWVKTSLAPGSRVVTDYLTKAGLQQYLDWLGFNLVGYGCMTCSGGSGQLDRHVAEAIQKSNLVVATVLSGNRNFEGRIHPLARANYLASPALVVAYACAGSIALDLTSVPLAFEPSGRPVYLDDVWPSDQEIEAVMAEVLGPELFNERYAHVFDGDDLWQALPAEGGTNYNWNPDSTYIQRPPFFDDDVAAEGFGTGDIVAARPLAILGDSITTDHISPVSAIQVNSVPGAYLTARGVAPADLNTLLTRRGNHHVMIRGTFANVRLRNEMVPGREGGFTSYQPSGEIISIPDAAARYRADGVQLVLVAGADYGSGSSRDWAAKGPRLLGVRAVIAESFERIHRSNLVGMGVLPLQFLPGVTRRTLNLTGQETFTVTGLDRALTPRETLSCLIVYPDGSCETTTLICRLDIPREIAWYRSGGILPYVANNLLQKRARANHHISTEATP